MRSVSVIIPNYNGISYLSICLDALRAQTCTDFETIVVDNGSADGSLALLMEQYPEVRVIALPENTGFCHAVNEGVRAADTEYVIFLNNDTEVFPDFIGQLLAGMRAHPKAFSGASKMLQYHRKDCIDDAGNFYCALGWAFARGKGQDSARYEKEGRIFAACAGAAIYRKCVLDEIGLLDEAHFAYLEDIDLGYRARIYGYENWYFPQAKVYHVGSATSGSRYNAFKTRLSSRNNVYLITKNMPLLQWVINLPFLAAGFGIKALFFRKKGLGTEYREGLKEGRRYGREPENRGKKVRFRWIHLGNYLRIQLELWGNLFRLSR